MITDILSSIQRDRANYVRNLAYLKEMAMDDEIADRMDKVEHKFERATADDYESAMDVIREMADDYPDEDEAEIRRLMEATEDLTFEEMIGLSDED